MADFQQHMPPQQPQGFQQNQYPPQQQGVYVQPGQPNDVYQAQ